MHEVLPPLTCKPLSLKLILKTWYRDLPKTLFAFQWGYKITPQPQQRIPEYNWSQTTRIRFSEFLWMDVVSLEDLVPPSPMLRKIFFIDPLFTRDQEPQWVEYSAPKEGMLQRHIANCLKDKKLAVNRHVEESIPPNAEVYELIWESVPSRKLALKSHQVTRG